MTQKERRAKILELLGQADLPLTGSYLSSTLGVTRQVIVSDVAVLRAGGEKIIATPQGYLLYKPQQEAVHKSTVAVQHGGEEDMANELYLIVELGGTVLDVTVEHPLYGEITGNLQLSSKADVQKFVEKMQTLEAEPLLVLTGGYHLHTIEAPTSEVMGAIREALRQAGYLVE